MASLSNADKSNLNAQEQKQVEEQKKKWQAAYAAGDQAGMDAAHAEAERIRASAGYSGGAAGNGYTKLAASKGGQSADQVAAWVEDYNAVNYDPVKGWINGYDTSANVRSRSNYIRQQMLANSEAWKQADEATKEYLHQQNLALAKLLEQENGGAASVYDEKTGRWSTWNADVGYGEDKNYVNPTFVNSVRQYLGYSDEDLAKWKNDRNRYYNFVDQAIIRKDVDESGGYTGRYQSAAYGPSLALMAIGGGTALNQGVQVETEALNDYLASKSAYVENGVIRPGILTMNSSSKGANGTYTGVKPGEKVYVKDFANPYAESYVQAAQNAGKKVLPTVSGGTAYGSGTKGGTYADYIEQMYEATLRGQLKELETAYEKNLADLNAGEADIRSAYMQQRLQADGMAARDAAAWRETANAYGLNSGAFGQAALAQNNQLQSELRSIHASQTAALTELEQQRLTLRQEYRSAIIQAQAENDYKKANALYEEAIRAEEALWEKQQFYADQNMQLLKLMISASQKVSSGKQQSQTGGSSGSSNSSVSSNSSETSNTPDTPGVEIPSYGDGVIEEKEDEVYLALGSEAFYEEIRKNAADVGQSGADFIVQNYRVLGIPYSKLGRYVTGYEKWELEKKRAELMARLS